MREDATVLTALKVRCAIRLVLTAQNEFTYELHVNLHKVAQLQYRITELVAPLKALDAELHSKAPFPHLSRLHQLPTAYAAAVVEVVRRKEFVQFLAEWTSRLANTLEKYTETERKRRQLVKAEMLSNLPWSIAALEETSPLSVGIKLVSGEDALEAINLNRSDIESESDLAPASCGLMRDLVHWVESLRSDPDILASIEAEDSDPVAFLQTNLDGLISRMDGFSAELDRMVERSGGDQCSSIAYPQYFSPCPRGGNL